MTTVTGATSAPPTAGGTNPAIQTAGKAELDREAFLKLLVAQLKYQDPGKPVDATQMIAQSAQLTMVDKLEQISRTLNDSALSNRLSLGSSIIGKVVTYLDDEGTTKAALVGGVAVDGTKTILRSSAGDIPLEKVLSVMALPDEPPVAGDPAS